MIEIKKPKTKEPSKKQVLLDMLYDKTTDLVKSDRSGMHEVVGLYVQCIVMLESGE